MTPTQRTMDELRKRGYTVGRVEQWRPGPNGGFRQDLFGIIDLLAISGDLTIGVQVCGTAWSAHVKKLLGRDPEYPEAEQAVRRWLESPHRYMELWGWRPLKYGERRIHRLRRGMIYIRYDGAPIEFEEVESA